MKLRDFRHQKRLTQEACAALLDTNQSTISRLESGDLRPSLARAREIQRLTSGAVKLSDWPDEA